MANRHLAELHSPIISPQSTPSSPGSPVVTACGPRNRISRSPSRNSNRYQASRSRSPKRVHAAREIRPSQQRSRSPSLRSRRRQETDELREMFGNRRDVTRQPIRECGQPDTDGYYDHFYRRTTLTMDDANPRNLRTARAIYDLTQVLRAIQRGGIDTEVVWDAIVQLSYTENVWTGSHRQMMNDLSLYKLHLQHDRRYSMRSWAEYHHANHNHNFCEQYNVNCYQLEMDRDLRK